MGKNNVSVSKEVMRNLRAQRERLAAQLGFTPSYSHTIAYLLRATGRP